MDIREAYKLTDEERQKFLEKENTIVSNAQKFDLYEDYITSQKKPFLDLMNYLNDFLNDLKARGEISDFVEYRARIKAPSSALCNDNQKALDDAFGMELVCATEDEINFLLDKLYEFMKVTKPKSFSKPNGYKAEHRYLTLKDDCYNLLYPDLEKDDYINQPIPLIEFQLKTIEVAIKADIGTAAHSAYKGDNKDEIQKAYDDGNLKVGTNLPRMWCSINGEMVLLSDEQTAKKLYPFLDITRKKEINFCDE